MKKIIFLPGLACDERLFTHQINFFKNQFDITTIICDTGDNMSAHVDHVLTQSPEKFILMGHSFGGWVAQWVAIHAPARVSQLVLMGTSSGKLTTELKNIFKEMHRNFENNKAMEFFDKVRQLSVHGKRTEDIELHETIKRMQIAFSKESLINQVKTDLEGKDTTAYLKHIKCETLLLHGKQDPFYANDMQLLAENIPNNNFVEIDQCGHFLPLEQPTLVSELIGKWFMELGLMSVNCF